MRYALRVSSIIVEVDRRVMETLFDRRSENPWAYVALTLIKQSVQMSIAFGTIAPQEAE